MNQRMKATIVFGGLVLTAAAVALLRPGEEGAVKSASSPSQAAPATTSAATKPTAVKFKPKALPTPKLAKIERASAPVRDDREFAESLREYSALRVKVLRAPEEDRVYGEALRSRPFLQTAKEYLSRPSASPNEEVSMAATQVLIDALKADNGGYAKEAIRQLITDGAMDKKEFSPAQRQAAARDRAELMFHYLAIHSGERPAVKAQLKLPNAASVYASVEREHSRNVASSQAEGLRRTAK